MIIKTERLILRPWELRDAQELSIIANNPNVSKNLIETFPYPYTLKAAKSWTKSNVGLRRETHFVITLDDRIVGGIGFGIDPQDQTVATIGYWLGEDYWGKGIATEALINVTDYAFENFGLKKVEARVYMWNPQSAHVLEKAGYRLENTLRNSSLKAGILVDEWLYSKDRNKG